MTDKREQDHHGDAFRPIRRSLLALRSLAIMAGRD